MRHLERKHKKLTDSITIIEKEKQPVVRALIIPALLPLKSLKTSSTVRWLYGIAPSIRCRSKKGSDLQIFFFFFFNGDLQKKEGLGFSKGS